MHACRPGGWEPASQAGPRLTQQDPGNGQAGGLGREEAGQDGPHAVMCLCPAHIQGPRVEQQQNDRTPGSCREVAITESSVAALLGWRRGVPWMGNTWVG